MFDAPGAADFTGSVDRARKLGTRLVSSGLQPLSRAMLMRMHARDHPANTANEPGFEQGVSAARGLLGLRAVHPD